MFEQRHRRISALFFTIMTAVFAFFYLKEYRQHVLKTKQILSKKVNNRIKHDIKSSIDQTKNQLRSLADIAAESNQLSKDTILRSIYRNILLQKDMIKLQVLKVSYDGNISLLAEADTTNTSDKRFGGRDHKNLFKKLSDLSRNLSQKTFYHLSSLFYMTNVSHETKLPIVSFLTIKQLDQGDFIFAVAFYWSDYFVKDLGFNKNISILNKKNQVLASSSLKQMLKKSSFLAFKKDEDSFYVKNVPYPFDHKAYIINFIALMICIMMIYFVYLSFSQKIWFDISQLRAIDQSLSRQKQNDFQNVFDRHYLRFSHQIRPSPGHHALEASKNEWFFDDFTSAYERVIAIASISASDADYASIKTILELEVYRQLKNQQKHVGECLDSINDYLLEIKNKKIYVSCFILKIDYASNFITYANAAHPFPVVLSDKTFSLVNQGHQLGFLKDSHYETKSRLIESHEKIFIYSKNFSKQNKKLFKKSMILDLMSMANYSSHQISSVLVEHLNGKNQSFILIDVKQNTAKAIKKVA